MIIGDGHQYQVHQKIFELHDRLKNFENLPPARLRVMVRLPGADALRDAHLKVVLYVQQHATSEVDSPLPWAEEGRLILTSEEARQFQPFDNVFLADNNYNIRVEFLVTQVTPEGEHEQSFGYVLSELADVIDADNERLDVDLMAMTGERVPHRTAELAVDWLKFLHDKMVLEVRIKIEKKSGWPFSTARPFFVLYRWEPQYESWTPLYRSEVLTKGSAYPDSKGVMVFELAEIFVKRAIGGDHVRPLRLEFFHYKTRGNPKMLGFFVTSLQHLRQSRKQGTLRLELNTFPEGELVGGLRMVTSKITAGRSFFCLEAEFGGDVTGDFVYFDVSLTDAKAIRRGWRRNEGRPYYTIARYSDSGVWEQVYRSEVPSRVLGRLHKYKVAKLTERRLNGGRNRRSISVMFWQVVDGMQVEVGHVETTVSALLDADSGAVLPLAGAGVGNGYVRVEQSEETDSRLYFGLHCVLERSGGEGSSSNSEGQR